MENKKKIFILKLALFICFSVVIPIIYLIIRFDLFQKATRFGMGELICLLIVISIFVVLLKYYISGFKTKYSYLKQIIVGIIKTIIPLIILFLVLTWLNDNIYLLKEFLLVVIPSETVAVFLNPFPKWAFENNVDGLSEIVNKIFKKGE